MSKVNEDDSDDQLFGVSQTALKHYANAVEYEDYRNLERDSNDVTLISLWSEDPKGHLFAGKPITAKKLIKRPINESSGDETTNNAIK